MKKTAILILILLCVLILTSCNGKITYKLPHDQFCYTNSEERVEFELNQKDKEYIISLLNKDSWVDDQTACVSNFVFYTQKQQIYYCGECGVFNDVTSDRSIKLSEEERMTVNRILEIN